MDGSTLVLKADANSSLNVIVVAVTEPVPVGSGWLVHCGKVVEPPTLVLKLCCTKPTMGVGLVIGSADGFDVKIEACTGREPEAEPPPIPLAFSRMLVIRSVRFELVPGGTMGTP